MLQYHTTMNQQWRQDFNRMAYQASLTATHCNVRVIIAGPYQEVIFFGRPVLLPGFKPTAYTHWSVAELVDCDEDDSDDDCLDTASARLDGKRTSPPHKRTAAQNRHRHVGKRRSTIKNLVNTNFNPKTAQFVTLTFAEAVTDFRIAYREWQKFFRRLKKNVPDVKYVAVPERAQQGGWHLHLIIDRELPLTADKASSYKKAGVIKGKKGAWDGLWKLGIVHQKPLDKGGNLGASIAGYLTKSSNDTSLAGSHLIWHSKNLAKPTELTGSDAVALMKDLAESGQVPIYAYQVPNIEFVETKDVFEFCIDRKAAMYDRPWRQRQPSAQCKPVMHAGNLLVS